MQLTLEIRKRTFDFAFKAKTSRGPMQERTCWFLLLRDRNHNDIIGIGEVAPIFGLSKEQPGQIEADLVKLTEWINQFEHSKLPSNLFEINEELKELDLCSAVRFGIEMALLDLVQGGNRTVFNSGFKKGVPIPINGLVWMADADTMLLQAESKIRQGFNCIKFKVGSLDFDLEVGLIRKIREKYTSEQLKIRLDANGAFTSEQALSKLQILSDFEIHSLEQPIAAGNIAALKDICKNSPIPIALDEELIGLDSVDKTGFLIDVNPSFLILKPSLHGGFYQCAAWINAANSLNVGWWITSSLESAYGLNAIAQFVTQYRPQIPQGLGTGQIFINAPKSPLMVRNGFISYDSLCNWEEI
jgi:O-succinylbenzoate synthase